MGKKIRPRDQGFLERKRQATKARARIKRNRARAAEPSVARKQRGASDAPRSNAGIDKLREGGRIGWG